ILISVIHFSKFNTILYNLDLNLDLNANPKKSTEHTEDTGKNIVKDLFYVAYARNLRGNLHVKSKDLNGPEIYLRFYFPKIFLAKQHLKEDFPQRFLAKQPK
ncbi:MAG: hypothetical protein ACI3YS_01420, partial [Prevotella sp.]